MTSIISHILVLSLILPFISSSSAASSFPPKALVLPVTKDLSSLQYLLKLNQRTPSKPIALTLDLGAQFLWVDCEHNYVSSTYHPARCNSAQCKLANSKSCGKCNAPRRPGCNNNTCGLSPENPFTDTATGGELASDVVKVNSTDGLNPRQPVTVPNFLFVCGTTSLTKGLAKGSVGVAGLGRTKISMPSQFSAAFSFARKFAVCLSSRNSLTGVVFFGDGPYDLYLDVDARTVLKYTPLLINPVSTGATSFPGEQSTEYFIGVKTIKVGQKEVAINKALLSIDRKGNGGTKISTVKPYTVLQSSIHKAVSEAFVNGLTTAKTVAAVAPFKVCYNASSLQFTRGGLQVPTIDLVLQTEDVYWKIYGENSMVPVNDGKVYCLAFVDGGVRPRTSIVIGAYQLEDNLLQFDLARSRLGFSSSLLYNHMSCGFFNFTSV